MSRTFIKATKSAFSLSTGTIYRVHDSAITDDASLRRDPAGLVASGVAEWCTVDGKPTGQPPHASAPGMFTLSVIFETEAVQLLAFARAHRLKISIHSENAVTYVNLLSSSWAIPILLAMREGVSKAFEALPKS